MEQEQAVLPTPMEPNQEETAQEEQAPIKDVKTFWERLDEVLNQNNQMKERMNELLEQFPDTAPVGALYRSSVFQPERVCLSSNNSQEIQYTPGVEQNPQSGHQPGETFYQFRNRLQRALVNVKSIQLLSAVVPNVIQNIPDNQTIFFYYKIPRLSETAVAWSAISLYQPADVVTYNGSYYVALEPNQNVIPGSDPDTWYLSPVNGPNYYKIFANPEEVINVVILLPTFAYTADLLPGVNQTLFNRTFTSYGDLVDTLNACAQSAITASDPGDIEFTYNDTLNKIQMEGLSIDYYYLPCGYDDERINVYLANYLNDPFWSPPAPLQTPELNPYDMWSQGYTLNLRLGFTWNGQIPFFDGTDASEDLIQNALWNYLRPTDPVFIAPYQYDQDILTFNSYPDLVNTSTVRILCDVVQGSTEDTNEQVGLLSIIPMNTSNLGVTFYQNNFNNELTKIPKIITEIGITLINDQGQPFVLPNSAVVLLELAITYH